MPLEEVSDEERARRRALAERIGTAPGAPGFSLGPARNPSTPGLRIQQPGSTGPTALQVLAETALPSRRFKLVGGEPAEASTSEWL